MIRLSARSRQPQRTAWSNERLLHEHALALGHAIESSTAITYTSHLQLYLSFCKLHHLPITPTIDTFSFYVVYMCHHINPCLVATYLSGICNNLEPYFPSVRTIRNNPLVIRSLTGMKKLKGSIPTHCRCALNEEDLVYLVKIFSTSLYDDCLFLAILLTGFYGLM